MSEPEEELDEPKSEPSPEMEKAGEWLMFLSSTLGLKHADAVSACETVGGKVIDDGKDSEVGKLFNCDDGYQFMERDGTVVYVVDGAYPFTKTLLEELMGPPATKRVREADGVKLVGYFWPLKIQQVLLVEFWEVHDPKGPSPTFVGISRPVLDGPIKKSGQKHP